jgi:acetyl esterase/lipase
MINKTIDIWEGLTYQSKNVNDFRPTLDTYVLSGNKKRGAVLIFPGGGYGFTSDREAEPIAMKYNSAGYHAFVLYYSVAPAKHPQPLIDAVRAINIMRENAEAWNVDPDKIAVSGFSAGGHLAASFGVHWKKPYLYNNSGLDIETARPNALILSYPVITSGEYAHKGSFINLLGEDAESSLLKEMSLEHQVNATTPPTFIWHTIEDGLVPVENTLLFAQELRNNNIPFELHIYPKGGHGLSLATNETGENDQIDPHVSTWMELSIQWLDLVFGN